MVNEEPTLVTSAKSQRVVVDGYPFSIEIYRLEDQLHWTLEVVDAEGASHVWDDTFASDSEALQAAITELDQTGAQTFMRGDNVIPFKP